MSEKKLKVVGILATVVALGANLVSTLTSKKEQEHQIERAVEKHIAKLTGGNKEN